MIVATALCTCAKRQAAQASGEFVFLPHARAWVFTDEEAPKRALTWRARYYLPAGERDHTGEPYQWETCPFCGLDLECRPSVVDRIRESEGTDTLGDPES